MVQTAIAIGLGSIAGVFIIGGLFSKAVWMRFLLFFSGLIDVITLNAILIKIADDAALTDISTILQGFYSVSVFITITALALFIVNILWDYTNLFVGIEKWSQKFTKKKPETLEE